MSLTFRSPKPNVLTIQSVPEVETGLDIVVLYTSAHATAAAMKRAGSLAENLNARLTLIVAQVVPYPLPLTAPPVSVGFTEKQLSQFAAETPVETRVQLLLCRDKVQALKAALKADSVVVMAGPGRWWPTREKRLARRLSREGYEVIFTEAE